MYKVKSQLLVPTHDYLLQNNISIYLYTAQVLTQSEYYLQYVAFMNFDCHTCSVSSLPHKQLEALKAIIILLFKQLNHSINYCACVVCQQNHRTILTVTIITNTRAPVLCSHIYYDIYHTEENKAIIIVNIVNIVISLFCNSRQFCITLS